MAKLMSQLTKTSVVYDFRQEDLKKNGQGAPLTPIFHNLLSKKINKRYDIDFPICFINIGGISNITKVIKKDELLRENLEAFDSGPGNCMIDEWIRKNSKKRFDENGSIAKSGKINHLILNVGQKFHHLLDMTLMIIQLSFYNHLGLVQIKVINQ